MNKPDKSIQKAQKKFFYGWWIVISGILISVFTAGAFYYSFTFFVRPIAEEFGWSHAEILFGAGFRTVEFGLLAPVMGFLADRFGPRKVLFTGGLVGGLGFILLSQTSSLGMFYGALLILSLGFSACSAVVLTTAVAQWFRRKIGFAMGLTSAGFGLGAIVLPVISWLINRYEWDTTLVILGLATLIVVPACALVFRHRPEQYELSPDSDVEKLSDEVFGSKPSNVEFSVSQAMRTQAFWMLSIAFALGMLTTNSVIAALAPYLESRELSASSVALVVTFVPLLSIFGRIGFGWLGDITSKKHLLACTMVLQAIALLFFCGAPNLWALVGFLLFFGLGYGGTLGLRPSIQTDYFGRSRFGSINGMLVAASMFGGMIGPFFAGWVFDVRGDYQMAWLVLALGCITAVPLIMIMRFPGMPVKALNSIKTHRDS